MKYTVYRITNEANGKTYIGAHQTDDPNDAYMGSGKLIRLAIKKYGVENFRKEVLVVTSDENQMFESEVEWIKRESPDYNIHEGGNGGWKYVSENHRDRDYQSIGAKVSDTLKERGIKPSKRCIEAARQAHKDGNVQYTSFAGKKHSTESRRKMSEAKRGKSLGDKNSQFGTMWITDGEVNKKAPKDTQIPDGWKRGRVMK